MIHFSIINIQLPENALTTSSSDLSVMDAASFTAEYDMLLIILYKHTETDIRASWFAVGTRLISVSNKFLTAAMKVPSVLLTHL